MARPRWPSPRGSCGLRSRPATPSGEALDLDPEDLDLASGSAASWQRGLGHVG